jgi:hypothetical protein
MRSLYQNFSEIKKYIRRAMTRHSACREPRGGSVAPASLEKTEDYHDVI